MGNRLGFPKFHDRPFLFFVADGLPEDRDAVCRPDDRAPTSNMRLSWVVFSDLRGWRPTGRSAVVTGSGSIADVTLCRSVTVDPVVTPATYRAAPAAQAPPSDRLDWLF
jgi:hypothetical protein